MRGPILVAVVALLAAAAPTARALPLVEWTFTGTISEGEAATFGGAGIGAPFRVSAVLDPDAPDLCTAAPCSPDFLDPMTWGQYALVSYATELGGVFRTAAGGEVRVGDEALVRGTGSVFCDPIGEPCAVRDSVAVFVDLPLEDQTVSIIVGLGGVSRSREDSPGGPLANDALPGSLALDDWNERVFVVIDASGVATGTVDTFSARIVPEPSTALLVVLPLLAAVLRRRRAQAMPDLFRSSAR